MCKKTLGLSCLLTALLAFAPLTAFPCTDFLINQNGNVMNGRSMEFAEDMHSQLMIKARGEKNASTAPGNKPGMTWTNRYGYVALNAFQMDIVTDGLNEEGLSIGDLWLPGSRYQDVSNSPTNQILLLNDFPAWILGNFKNVDEVKVGVQSVKVWGAVEAQIGIMPPLHFSIHDANGKSLVIEFIDGQMEVKDNPVHVLTNAPNFDWHLDNLSNYVSLTNQDPPTIFRGQAVNGSGLLGIPGNWTPPARFVRAVMMTRFAKPAKDAAEAMNLAWHILNVVDIPHGIMQSKVKGKVVSDYTQWAVVKDLKNKVLYYRTYENLNIRSFDLKKVDWAKLTQMKKIPIQSAHSISEVEL